MPETVVNQYEPSRVSAPGETLLETIEALGMTQAELADRLGRPRKTINEIIRAKAAITPETALQLESVLGVPAQFWIAREARYREYLARRQELHQLAGAGDWARQFPFRAMLRHGWVREAPAGAQRARELLRFFGVASPATWRETWEQQQVAFRRSSKVSGVSTAIAAWLRRGELVGQGIRCAPYQAELFRRALDDARGLTREAPEVFQPHLTDLFASAGVAVAWVPEMPGCPVSGATRWLSPEKALIQVSLRYKTDDQLWFSIFHEAIHVWKHARKGVFLEQGRRESDDEREADRLAADILIPPEHFARLAASKPRFSAALIEGFARDLGLAPGIVVGRLQHERLLPFTHCNSLKVRLRWVAKQVP